jgi:hypothetical protein
MVVHSLLAALGRNLIKGTDNESGAAACEKLDGSQFLVSLLPPLFAARDGNCDDGHHKSPSSLGILLNLLMIATTTTAAAAASSETKSAGAGSVSTSGRSAAVAAQKEALALTKELAGLFSERDALGETFLSEFVSGKVTAAVNTSATSPKEVCRVAFAEARNHLAHVRASANTAADLERLLQQQQQQQQQPMAAEFVEAYARCHLSCVRASRDATKVIVSVMKRHARGVMAAARLQESASPSSSSSASASTSSSSSSSSSSAAAAAAATPTAAAAAAAATAAAAAAAAIKKTEVESKMLSRQQHREDAVKIALKRAKEKAEQLRTMEEATAMVQAHDKVMGDICTWHQLHSH